MAEPNRRDQGAIVAAFAGAESIDTLFPMTVEDSAPASRADVDQGRADHHSPFRTVDAAEVQADALEQRRADLQTEAAGIRKDLARVTLRDGVEEFKRRVRQGR